MSSEKLQSQEKAQGGFHENRVFWVSSFDLSCLACLPLPVSPRQSVSPAVSQTSYSTSGGECAQCEISGNILKGHGLKTVSADGFVNSQSVSCSSTRQNNVILLICDRCSIYWNILYAKQHHLCRGLDSFWFRNVDQTEQNYGKRHL